MVSSIAKIYATAIFHTLSAINNTEVGGQYEWLVWSYFRGPKFLLHGNSSIRGSLFLVDETRVNDLVVIVR